MGTSNIAALRFPAATGVAPNVPLYLDQLTQDLDPQVIPRFATVGARNTAYAGLTETQKRGSICYVADREGHCRWSHTSNNWDWMPESRVIYLGTRASAADTTATSTSGAVPILLSGAVTLPPGNRLVEIQASVLIDNLSASVSAVPRAYVTGFAGSDGDNWMQGTIAAGGVADSRSRSWLLVMSGTVDVDLRGLNAGGGGAAVRFSHSFLSVIDRGPTDA